MIKGTFIFFVGRFVRPFEAYLSKIKNYLYLVTRTISLCTCCSKCLKSVGLLIIRMPGRLATFGNYCILKTEASKYRYNTLDANPKPILHENV